MPGVARLIAVNLSFQVPNNATSSGLKKVLCCLFTTIVYRLRRY